MTFRYSVGAALALGALVFSLPAVAGGLPAPAYQVVVGPSEVHDKAGSFTGAGGSASVAAYPAVVLQASADQSSGASADLWYYFTVIGPDCGSCIIPIDLATTLTARSTPDQARGLSAYARASLRVEGLTEGYQFVNTADGLESFSGTWSGNIHTTTVAGYQNGVNVHAEAAGFSAEAYADPKIFIDPSFMATDPDYLAHYSIQLSQGVGNALPNVSGVPEPATWGLMLIGFAGMGAVLRRRSKPAFA